MSGDIAETNPAHSLVPPSRLASISRLVPLGLSHGADDKPGLDDLLYMSYTSGEDGRDVQVRLMQQVRPHWRELAIALKFPQHEIAIMEKKDNPVYYLLSEWLRGANQTDPRPVTWRTLIEALRHADLQEEVTVLKKHFIQGPDVTIPNAVAAGYMMQHGSIEVIVNPGVSRGLLFLMEEYAEMLFVLRKTKLPEEELTELTLYLSGYVQSDEACKCTTLRHVIDFLQNELKIWIFNIDTLNAIKKKIKSSEVTSSIEQYRQYLKEFFSSTSVKELKDALKVHINDPSHAFESITLKLDESRNNDTLKNLEKLVYDSFGVRGRALIFIRTGMGCVCVTWLVPTSLVSTMRAIAEQHSEEYLANLGVLELVIGLRVVPNEASTSHSDIKKQYSRLTGGDSYRQVVGAMCLEIQNLKRKSEVLDKKSDYKKCEQLEAELKTVRKEKSDYEEKCEQQEAELKMIIKEKSDYEEKCEQKEAELKTVRKEKSDYKEKCEQQEAELKTVHKEKLDYEEKCERKEAELKLVRKEKSEYEEKCEQQGAELKTVRKEKSDYEEKCEQQEAELKLVHKEKSDYEEKCERQEAEAKEFEEQTLKKFEKPEREKKVLVLQEESKDDIVAIKARPSVTSIELGITSDVDQVADGYQTRRATNPNTPLHQRVVPFQFTFYKYDSRSKFTSKVKKSQRPYIGIDESLKSHPFYTHEYGYKMCIGVAPQGVFEGKGTHLSLYAYLMKGDYDSNLPWPFRGTVHLQLINQLDPNEGHYNQGDTIVFNDTIPSMSCARVTMGDYSPHGWASCKFISNVKLHYDQDKKTQYLKDDTIIIKVIAVTMPNKIMYIRSQPLLPPTMSTINTPKEQRIVPYEFTMNYIEKCKADEPWFSSEFYSHKNGYLMCVEVVPTGKDTGEGTHLSIYIHLMKGDFDEDLIWPFQGKVTIQLLNQEADERHRELLIYFTEHLPAMYCKRVTEGDCSPHGWGTDVFISRSALERDEEYLEKFMKDGILKFRVINVTLIETKQF